MKARPISANEESSPSQPTGEATAAAFIAWADSFPDTPLLSDEAVSRDSMYPDRE